MSEILRGEKDIVDDTVEAAWKKMATNESQTRIILERDKFTTNPVGVQRRLLRKGINKLLPDQRDIEFGLIERTREFIDAAENGQVELLRDLLIEKEGQKYIIRHDSDQVCLATFPQIEKEYRIEEKSAIVNINEHWSFTIKELIPKDHAINKKNDPFEVFMDSEHVSLPITIRSQTPGDRFYPLGMGGKSMKLSDFWINRKLARKYRAKYPLICDKKEIIWIPGFQPCEKVRINAGSTQIIHLEIIKKK
jgi:tRNA(Ile)-lysidine synthase